MSDEMQIDGKSYISSKRAAGLSGYAQDYIGQLARKSLIDARRIGGLWYVSMDSLTAYKKKADEYKPQPPARVDVPDPATLIFFDGKEYLSAARAAEQTGYAQDYVGQLARSGTIESRQVGNRWYVEKTSIIEHKKEKDGLLAAVQTQSVGLSKPNEIVAEPVKTIDTSSEPLLTYFNEPDDLMPALKEQNDKSDEYIEPKRHSGEQDIAIVSTAQSVPIKKIQTIQIPRPVYTPAPAVIKRLPTPRAAKNKPTTAMLPMLIGAAATIVIVLSVGYVSVFKKNSVYAMGHATSSAMPASVSIAFSKFGDLLEPFLTHELNYTRTSSQ